MANSARATAAWRRRSGCRTTSCRRSSGGVPDAGAGADGGVRRAHPRGDARPARPGRRANPGEPGRHEPVAAAPAGAIPAARPGAGPRARLAEAEPGEAGPAREAALRLYLDAARVASDWGAAAIPPGPGRPGRRSPAGGRPRCGWTSRRGVGRRHRARRGVRRDRPRLLDRGGPDGPLRRPRPPPRVPGGPRDRAAVRRRGVGPADGARAAQLPRLHPHPPSAFPRGLPSSADRARPRP